MDKNVLIITHSEDGEHVDLVTHHLNRHGIGWQRLNVDQICNGPEVVTFKSADANPDFLFEISGTKVSGEQTQSIWYRKPHYFNLRFSDTAQQRFAETEIRLILDGIWLGMQTKTWINSPESAWKSRHKLYQLRLAKKLGMKTPETIVTNDPVAARQFLETFGEVVFKTVGQGYLEETDSVAVIPTTLLTKSHIENLSLVRSLPAMFQRHIKKIRECRITVVGDEAFSVQLTPNTEPFDGVDWRDPVFYGEIGMTPCTTPDYIIEKCHELMLCLGLKYGAFDFVVDATNTWYFLEVNPHGQWHWIERFTGLPISDSIARMLISSGGR